MRDWRLDSESGGNGLPLDAVVCAVGRAWAADGNMRCGGGAGAHTYIVLDRVCERHVLVVGGRTYERGFTVNVEGMSLTLSKAIPWVGRVFVLGFGRVIKEKRPSDWTRVRPVAEHFPAARAINAGHHPYEWMPSSSKFSDPANGTAYTQSALYPYARNHVAATLANAPRIYDPRLLNPGPGGNRDLYHRAGIMNAWGRAEPYTAYGFAATGDVLRLDVAAGVMRATGAKIPLEKVSVFGGIVKPDSFARHLYFNNLIPDEDGNLYAFPRRRGLPVLKLPAPAYDDLVSLGEATADHGVPYLDPFDPATVIGQGPMLPASSGYSTFIRLFDGRVLGFPMYLASGTANANETLALFDPAAAASEDIPLPPKAGGYGISRWTLPVQAADGKVYARPSVAPGNLTLIFDPVTKQIDLDDFGYAPQRMDIQCTDGVPCANGRIYYCQTRGAATDINRFFVLDTASRTSEVVDLGFVHSTVFPFFSSLALSDGCPVFLGPSYANTSYNTTLTNIDKGYNRLIYDPWRDDFALYRSLPHGGTSAWRTWTYLVGDNPVSNDCSRDSADRRWQFGVRFLLPEFTLMTMEFDLTGNTNSPVRDPSYTCHYLETPPQAFPGAYCRQAFFGRCC